MSLFVLPRSWVISGVSKIEPGATLGFYSVGTTTLKTIYSDPGLSVAQANPVTVDSAGTYPEIYLDGNYKLVVTSANGTQKYSVDEIWGVPRIQNYTVNNLASLTSQTPSEGDRVYFKGRGSYVYDSTSTAAENGGTIIAPDSGVGRWLWAESGGVPLSAWGVVADGVTDDTAAFQAALDSGVRHLLIPDTGEKVVFSNVIISAQTENDTGLILEGQNSTESGNIGTWLQATSLDAAAIEIEDGGVTLRNFRLDSTSARKASAFEPAGIHFRGDETSLTLAGVMCEDVWIMNQPGIAWHVEGVELGTFRNCNGNSSKLGWYLDGTNGVGSIGISNQFIGCRAFNNDTYGWRCSSWFNTFIGCQSLSNSQAASLVGGTGVDVYFEAQNNIWLNGDVENQALHADTGNKPTTMIGIELEGKDNQVIGGIVAGYDTGILVEGGQCQISGVNFNNAGAGGNMTYAVDNAAVNDTYVNVSTNSNPISVSTLVRNKVCVGYIDQILYAGNGIRETKAPTTYSSTGAVDPTDVTAILDTNGAFTLATTAENGTHMTLICTSSTGNSVVTPATFHNGTTLTLAQGESAHLKCYTSVGWVYQGGDGTIA